MPFKYDIEKKTVLHLCNKEKIFIEGWAVSTEGNVPSFRLYVNDEAILARQVYVERADISEKVSVTVNDSKRNPHSFGFRITADVFQQISTVRLEAVFEDEKETILNLSEVDSISYRDSLAVRLDSDCVDMSNGLAKVTGWCVTSESQFDIHVNGKNGICDSSFHKTTRYDLCDAGFVDESEKLCGFDLTFVPDGSEEYTIEISNGTDTVMKTVSPVKAAAKSHVLRSLITNINVETIKKAVQYLKIFGFKELINRLKKGYQPYTAYDTWFRNHRVTVSEIESQKKYVFEYSPKISIAVPVYNTPVDMLRTMIDSVVEQTYTNWELCIADAGEGGHPSKDVLKEYSQNDKRIKVVTLTENHGIAGNTNKAFELATGDYIGLLDHDDFVEPDALYEVVRKLNEYPYDCLYTDEDKFDTTTGKYDEPNFKPDFNIDALRSHNYITHFFVARRELIEKCGGEHSKYDGAQDYDLILRCSELANRVGHIDKSLYHWRIYSGSTAGNPEQKLYAYEAGRLAIEDHLKRCGLKGTVEMMQKPYWGMYHAVYEVENNPLVSVIIPNYENKEVLERCINSLFNMNTYRNFEVVIVENNSSSKEIFDYYEKVQKEHGNVRVVTWEGKEFNYSAINNFGVRHSKGDYLLLLNNDTEVISPTAISEMLGICQREDVGVVGAKLLYPDRTVQHAGVMVGIGGAAGHLFSRILNQDPGYMMRAIINYDYSSVTGACLMTKKSVYEQVNGLDEELKVAYNDVDYCLKVRALNQLVVYNGYSQWYHYESVSRGYETDMKKIRRFDSEIELFQKKWKDILIEGDPYYNRNLMDGRIAK